MKSPSVSCAPSLKTTSRGHQWPVHHTLGARDPVPVSLSGKFHAHLGKPSFLPFDRALYVAVALGMPVTLQGKVCCVAFSSGGHGQEAN